MIESIIAFFKALAAFLASIGIDPAHLFAGVAGAFVRAVVQGKKLTWELVSTVIVGALCATYLTPIAVAYLGLAATNGLAFGIGLIGMSIAEGFVKMGQRWANNPKLPRSMDAKGLADAVNQDRPVPVDDHKDPKDPE